MGLKEKNKKKNTPESQELLKHTLSHPSVLNASSLIKYQMGSPITLSSVYDLKNYNIERFTSNSVCTLRSPYAAKSGISLPSTSLHRFCCRYLGQEKGGGWGRRVIVDVGCLGSEGSSTRAVVYRWADLPNRQKSFRWGTYGGWDKERNLSLMRFDDI